MDELWIVLQAVLPASLLAGALLALAWWPRRGAGSPRAPGWTGALAFSAAYAAGHALSDVLPPIPPREATHRLFWLALGAGVLGVLDGRLAGFPRFALRAAASALVPWWFLLAFVARWDAGLAVTSIGGLGLGLLVLWSGLEALAERRPGASLPLALWSVAACGSGALVLSGNLTYSLLAAALAAALGAAVVIAWLAPAFSLARGAAAVISVVLACLWIGGAFLSELPRASALLLGAAPLAVWAGEARSVTRRPPAQGALIRLAAAALPAAVALALAAWASESDPYYG